MKKTKIIVVGTRGIPDILGGVETHCQEIYPLLIDKGCDITIVRRTPYITSSNKISEYKGIKLKDIYAPKMKSFEAIIHTFLCVIYAAFKRPDILHIHAIGPSMMAPFARLLGLKVIMTHHGPDYERQKWGKAAKAILKIGEYMGVKFSNKVIVISENIGSQIKEKYGRADYILIPNGVPIPEKNYNSDYLSELGLSKQKYIFTLGRFVPEKGFDYLINAYKKSGVSNNYKLVIAGNADHETDYSLKLKQLAKEEGVVLTGFIKGNKLSQLFTHAGIFILPSFYEGLPIALLESMSYNLNILASDIPANTQVKLPVNSFFKVGDIDELSQKISQVLSQPLESVDYDLSNYRWDEIAKETYNVYQTI